MLLFEYLALRAYEDLRDPLLLLKQLPIRRGGQLLEPSLLLRDRARRDDKRLHNSSLLAQHSRRDTTKSLLLQLKRARKAAARQRLVELPLLLNQLANRIVFRISKGHFDDRTTARGVRGGRRYRRSATVVLVEVGRTQARSCRAPNERAWG